MDRYVLITGGELHNKGAQSMTFITVSELKRRFPKNKIVLISNIDYEKNKNNKGTFDFEILPLDNSIIFSLLGGNYNFMYSILNLLTRKKKVKDKYLINKYRRILENTDAIFDVSGFALSSQRGFGSSLSYLLRLLLASKRKIKTYIMPQSFGPFNYSSKRANFIINKLIKKTLRHPVTVFAREEEGYIVLTQKYGLKNVRLSKDMVLRTKDYNLENVYTITPNIRSVKFINQKNNIGIVPNMKNFVHGDREILLKYYKQMVDKLLRSGKRVYLIRHSNEDLEACKSIKSIYEDEDRVILVEDEFNCYEFDNLVPFFDFLIASRYHSIIHAYKKGIPCIAIGWATKYHELLRTFNQQDYIFDVRDGDFSKINASIDRLLKEYNNESNKIKFELEKIQKENIFDSIL